MSPEMSPDARLVLDELDPEYGVEPLVLTGKLRMPSERVGAALRELRARGCAKPCAVGRWKRGRCPSLPEPRDWVTPGERRVLDALPHGHVLPLREIARRARMNRHHASLMLRRLCVLGFVRSDFAFVATFQRTTAEPSDTRKPPTRVPAPRMRTDAREDMLRTVRDAGARGLRLDDVVIGMRVYAHRDLVSKWLKEALARGDVECIGATHGCRHGRWRVPVREPEPKAVRPQPPRDQSPPPASAFDPATLAALERVRAKMQPKRRHPMMAGRAA